MYTHVKIQDTDDIQPGAIQKIKKGDFVTLVYSEPGEKYKDRIYYEFEEQRGALYDSSLFLPLPPQKEKTVYVVVEKEVTILEPCEN